MVKAGHKIHREASKPVQSLCSSEGKKKYKGVRMRSWGSWVSEIRAPNQKIRIWLGSYSTAEAAARAYDAALLCVKGSKANLNFPLNASTHYIPQDTVLSPKSIQRVAAAAANSFVDNASTPPSPPPPSNSNSTSTSSSSVSSSPSDQMDDDVSLISSSGENEPVAMMESWYNFVDLQSPKYIDQMISGALFDIDIHTTHSHLLDDLYEEESDIPLWSFC